MNIFYRRVFIIKKLIGTAVALRTSDRVRASGQIVRRRLSNLTGQRLLVWSGPEITKVPFKDYEKNVLRKTTS